MTTYLNKYATQFAHLDNVYATIGRTIKDLVDGEDLTTLILEGPAGVGKTTIVRNYLAEFNHTRHTFVQGHITPQSLYLNIHAMSSRGSILILDDSDEALKSTDALNILKAATDTSKRTVSWITTRPIGAVPLHFETEGAIIILTNGTFANVTKSNRGAHLSAIMSRSYPITISDDIPANKFIQLCYMVERRGMLGQHTDAEKELLLSYINSRVSQQTFKQFDLRTAVKLSSLYTRRPNTWRGDADIML